MYRIYTGYRLESTDGILIYVAVRGVFKALVEQYTPRFRCSDIIIENVENLNDAVEMLKDFYDCNIHPDHKSLIYAAIISECHPI